MTLKNFFPHHFLTCRTSDKLTVSITTFIFGKSFANFVCAKMSVVFSILKLNLKHSHNAKQKFNRLATVVNIPQTMQAEFGLSHCCFEEDGKNISRLIYNVHTQPLFCILHLLFTGVPVAIAFVVFINSLFSLCYGYYLVHS